MRDTDRIALAIRGGHVTSAAIASACGFTVRKTCSVLNKMLVDRLLVRSGSPNNTRFRPNRYSYSLPPTPNPKEPTR